MSGVARPGSLRQSAATRLLAVVVLALVGMLAVVALLFVRASDDASKRGLDSALAHFRTQASRVDLEWRVQAESTLAQIEFMRVLDDPDPVSRNARLTAYMASFGGLGAFSHMQLLDARGEAQFRYFTRSQQDLPIPPADAGMASWVLGERDRTAYRALSLPVALGGQRGRLVLYAPLDNALLQRFAFPSTEVSVRLGQQVVAASRPETPPEDRLLSGVHVVERTGELSWSDEPGAPSMRVTRRAQVPLSLVETLLVVVASGSVVALLIWLVLGRWLGRQMARLRGVRVASEAFAASQQLSSAVSAELAAAAGQRNDEISQMARSVESMMRAVAQAQGELNESRAQLAALNASLEERVVERTRDLQAARDAALSAVRAKESFLANMSHEIRTPMNGMLGALELLGRTQLDAQQRVLLTTSATSGEALLAVLNDVLDYSKIEANRLELVQAPFSPAEVAGEAVRLFSAAAARKGVALDLETAGSLPGGVSGDAARLRQVLLNLIGNAVKFTDRGKVSVRLAAEPAVEGKVRLRFEVQDTGIGIEPALQASVFEPFVQVDAERRGGRSGTGLGLSICRRIVAAMGGELGVSSTPGAGSVFAFALELPVVSLPGAPAVVSATGLEALRGKVLLVDDNDINRLVAAEMLAMLGVTVEQCVNGQEAVDRLRSERFDLVLMDNQMPVLDGLAATRVIRADESSSARSRTPIIGLTANALEGDADRNLHAGMDGHVPKPISVKQLHAVLSKWLPAQPG